MGRQLAVDCAVLCQVVREHMEVAGLVGRDAHPIVVKCTRQILGRKTGYQVPGEVDGVELDVGDGVDKGASPGLTSEAPPRHITGSAKGRACRAGWTVWRAAGSDCS